MVVSGAKVAAFVAALWMSVIVGLAKDGVLVKLKKSALNLRVWRSPKRKLLPMEKSKFFCQGPRKQLRPTLP